MAERITRIRRVRPDVVVKSKGKVVSISKQEEKRLSEDLKSIAEMMVEYEQLGRDLEAAKAALFKDLTDYKLEHFAVPEAVAEITVSKGRASNNVNPEALMKVLSEEEFFDCVSVSVTKAKQYLGEKELATITEHIPGKIGDPKLDITLRKS